MAEIKATRIDFRLVHGQVATKWTKILDISKIIIIDDETAEDSFLCELFDLAAPQGVKVVVYDVKKAMERWNSKKFGKGRVLVLFKTVETAYKVWKEGFFYDDLCVGQVPGAEGRRIAYKTVNLNDQELEWLHELWQKDVKVYCQMVPDEKPMAFDDVYKKLKKED